MRIGVEMGMEVDVEYVSEEAKKKQLERRMKIADLKQICNRPDVVEVHSSFQ
jgi:hypothetical protein